MTVFVLVIYSSLSAQVLSLNQLNQTHGLSELTTSYLAQDSRKFLWIGTRDGLNRFDGTEVKIYRPRLKNDQIDPNLSSKVFEDSDGNLWFTTANAIHRLDWLTDDLVPFSLVNKHLVQQAATYHAFHLDREEKLWITANGNLYHFDIKTKKDTLIHELNSFLCYPVTDSTGKVTHIVNPLLDEGTGVEIISYKTGNQPVVERYFGRNDPNRLPSAFILFLHVENDSITWLPSNRGLIQFNLNDPLGSKFFIPAGFTKSPGFCDAKPWGHHYLWVSSLDQGVFLFDKRSQTFTRQDTMTLKQSGILNFRRIDNILVDQEQNLWLSSWGKGILYTSLENKKFSNLLRPEVTNLSVRRRPVNFISVEGNNRVWANVNRDGVYILGSEGQILEKKDPLKGFAKGFSGRYPKYYLHDSDGDVWLLSSTELALWDHETNQTKLIATRLQDLSKIVEISKGKFLLKSYDGIFEINKSTQPHQFPYTSPIIDFQDTYLFYTDSRDRILISDGRDKLHVYEYFEGAANFLITIDHVGYVNGMVEDNTRGTLWMASNKGLLKLDAITLDPEFVQDSLAELQRSLNCILFDTNKTLWLSSNNGLIHYDPTTGKVRRYTESDGLQSTQFRLGSCCSVPDGKLYFGAVDGAVSFHPDSIRDNSRPPLVHITKLVVNDKDQLLGENVLTLKGKTFPFSQRTLSFHFVGIEYSAPNENEYKYFLEGYDRDTVYAGTTRFARYGRLPAGSYTFNVWGANSDQIWTSKPKQFKVTILPPWYQTWWFKSLSVLVGLGLVIGGYQVRIQQIRRKEAFMRQEAEFRQKEAEYKQLVAETETAVLRLQMEPHFIFNSMNAINSYILKKDVDTASEYLNRFALLMRRILELSEHKFIDIQEETEFLELYLSAEGMRLGKKLKYFFEIDPELDDETLIPPMILQPFVENCIWHGISNQETEGQITIRFLYSTNALVCEIEDNGIGRQRSMRNKAKVHRSKALEITRRRLQLLSNEVSKEAKFDILDLEDDNGKALGTKVKVLIPLMD